MDEQIPKCVMCNEEVKTGRVFGARPEAKHLYRNLTGRDLEAALMNNPVCDKCLALDRESRKRMGLQALNREIIGMARSLGLTDAQHREILKGMPMLSEEDKKELLEIAEKKR